jgi:hypothetical protein
MSETKRVVIVKKKAVMALPSVTETFGRKARKTRARKARQEGMEFFTFCFQADKFTEFAEMCESKGKRPGEIVWSMIQREMGWSE